MHWLFIVLAHAKVLQLEQVSYCMTNNTLAPIHCTHPRALRLKQSVHQHTYT